MLEQYLERGFAKTRKGGLPCECCLLSEGRNALKASSETLKHQLARYEAQLRGLKSFIKELNDRTTEHGTAREHFEMDLLEAENNVRYYEDAIAHLKAEIKNSPKAEGSQTVADTILPRTVKQGIGFFVLSSVSFIAGAILGSSLKPQSEEQHRLEKKGEPGES